MQVGWRVGVERVRLAQALVVHAGHTDAHQCAGGGDGPATDAGDANSEWLRAAPVQCLASQLAAGNPNRGVLMWGAPQGNVYLAPGITDMYKSINTLALLLVETLGMEPVGPLWFVFCGRERDKLKILQWNTNGFWLHCRRLEQGQFTWPRDGQNQVALQVTARQLCRLLDGLQWQHAVAHQAMARHQVC